jgi:hypothetical protein
VDAGFGDALSWNGTAKEHGHDLFRTQFPRIENLARRPPFAMSQEPLRLHEERNRSALKIARKEENVSDYN